MPASTRIFVVALATSAQFPRLPDASMDTLTPMFASILALAVNSGVTFWLAQSLRAGSRLPASALRIRLCSSESRKPKAESRKPKAESPSTSPVRGSYPSTSEPTLAMQSPEAPSAAIRTHDRLAHTNASPPELLPALVRESTPWSFLRGPGRPDFAQ